MIPHSQTDIVPACRLCGKVAHHTITDERQKASHLCCYHYGKFFLQKYELCVHTEYPTITIDCGKMRGYNVKVTYVILPESERKLKEQAILRILAECS